MDLGAVQADRAKTREPVRTRDLQHLHENYRELLADAASKAGQSVVVRVLVAGDEAKGQRVAGGPLDPATGRRAHGVAQINSDSSIAGW